jgi:hypothetical protein
MGSKLALTQATLDTSRTASQLANKFIEKFLMR